MSELIYHLYRTHSQGPPLGQTTYAESSPWVPCLLQQLGLDIHSTWLRCSQPTDVPNALEATRGRLHNGLLSLFTWIPTPFALKATFQIYSHLCLSTPLRLPAWINCLLWVVSAALFSPSVLDLNTRYLRVICIPLWSCPLPLGPMTFISYSPCLPMYIALGLPQKTYSVVIAQLLTL